MSKQPKQLKCLPINLKHCSTASATLSQLILELNIDLIFIQEPYLTSNNKTLPNIP